MESEKLFHMLGRIEAELRQMQAMLAEHKTGTESAVADHEARLRVLEVAHAKAAGVIGLVALLGSGVGVFLWRIVSKAMGS